MAKNKVSSISKADTLEKMGEFWDSHDFTDYDDERLPDARFEVTNAVPIEEKLYFLVEKQAKRRGVKIETLVNIWLQEKLAEKPGRAAHK